MENQEEKRIEAENAFKKLVKGWRLPAPPRKLARILLLALMLVALFLRIYDLRRVPPGPFYDEAAATLLAGPVASGQTLPIFISNYTGHEVLYYYLTIPLIKLFGATVLALRLTSALIGTATVMMAYVLGRQLFADEPTVEPEWLGLFAAALACAGMVAVVGRSVQREHCPVDQWRHAEHRERGNDQDPVHGDPPMVATTLHHRSGSGKAWAGS